MYTIQWGHHVSFYQTKPKHVFIFYSVFCKNYCLFLFTQLLSQTEYDELSIYWRQEVRELQATREEGKSEEYPEDEVQVTVHRVSPTMSVQQPYQVELVSVFIK